MKKKSKTKVTKPMDDVSKTATIRMMAYCPYCGLQYSVYSNEEDPGHCTRESCKLKHETMMGTTWGTMTNGISVLNVAKNAELEAPKRKPGRPKKK